MWREIQYALRLLGKTPGFTALTVFVLAAGLCVAVYMYAFVRTLGYAELPYPDTDRLMMIGAVIDGKESPGNTISSYDFQQFAAEQSQFEIFIQSRDDIATLSGGELPRRVSVNYSNSQLFDITAVSPLLGRVLQPADIATGAPAVAVLSYDMWQREFDGDANIVGRTVKINGNLTSIVGVMPAGFVFPNWTDLWLPMQAPGALQAGEGPNTAIIAKLRAGATREEAEAQLKAVAKRIEQQQPLTNANRNVVIWPYVQQHITTGGMNVLNVMGAAAGCIFLLVLLNAGNLLLARAAERQKEIAIRAALGAPRLRLIRQMLWQALLLAVFGGVIGLFFASWGLRWNNLELETFITYMPFWWRFELSLSDLLFGLGLIVLTALAVGLYPALRASAGDINQFLRDGTRGAQSLRMTRMTHVLIMAEIALSISLLIVALSLAISTYSKVNVDYRARMDKVLIGNIDLYKPQYQTPSAHQQFVDQLQIRLSIQAGVEAVAFASHLPGMFGADETFLLEGHEVTDQRYPSAHRVVVSDNYFALFQISVLQGRVFDHRDSDTSERVLLVSKSFADKQWPEQSAVGKRLQLPRLRSEQPERHTEQKTEQKTAQNIEQQSGWYTVIGVVDDVLYQQSNLAHPDLSTLYLSQRQQPTTQLVIAVATQEEPMLLARAIATEVASIDTDLPVNGLMGLSDRIYRYTSNAGLVWITKQFLAMAALGVLLAASGIYGVIARSVALRTQELGVRRALGASEQRILLMLMQQGGFRFAIGGGIGLVLGVLMMHAMRYAMFGMDGKQTMVALAVMTLVGAIVALATLLPARKAITLTPAAALRHD